MNGTPWRRGKGVSVVATLLGVDLVGLGLVERTPWGVWTILVII